MVTVNGVTGVDMYTKLEVSSGLANSLIVVSHDEKLSMTWEDVFRGSRPGRPLDAGTRDWTRFSRPDGRTRTSFNHILAILSAWCAGAAVTVGSVPLRPRQSEARRARFEQLRQSIKPSLILGDEDHMSTLVIERSGLMLTLDEWRSGFANIRLNTLDRSASKPAMDDLAVLQATSGTTGRPRIAKVPYRCLVANHEAIIHGLSLSPGNDIFVSWLPLSHDMGLIGLLGTPALSGTSLVIADPQLFAEQPAAWMHWCAEYGATITGAPNFAFGIAASSMKSRRKMDLSNLQIVFNGAETVDVDICGEIRCCWPALRAQDWFDSSGLRIGRGNLGCNFSEAGFWR